MKEEPESTIGENYVFALIRYNVDESTGINEYRGEVLPEISALRQNYPNPFNPTTQIKYQLSTADKIKLTVYDLLQIK